MGIIQLPSTCWVCFDREIQTDIMGVTQKDIAERLGISRAQVGFALAGAAEVAPATRELVLATARELGYTRYSNQSARSLIAQRYGMRAATGVIGYCGENNRGQRRYGMHLYSAQLHDGIQEVVEAKGMTTLHLGENPAVIPWDKIDGVLSSCEPAKVRQRLHHDVPWVSLLWPWPEVPSVVADDEAGIRISIRHLLELGHRRIGYLISGYRSTNWHHDRRLTAYNDSLHAVGIEAVPRWVRHLPVPLPGDTAFQGGAYTRMQSWLGDDWRELGLTALLAHNDQAAMGAIAALQEAGLRVPEDISVVGFDGTEASECCTPRLTTVEVPLREIAARGAELLLDLLAGNSLAPEPVVLPVRLVARESTACFKS